MADDANGGLLVSIDHSIELACKVVLCLTCTAIFLILLVNVVLRYSMGTSLDWAAEIPELLFPWLVMAGVVLATVHNAHISIAFLVDRAGTTTALILAALRAILVTAAYGILSWVIVDLLPVVADERSPIMGVPNSVTYSCLLIGMLLIIIGEISIFLKYLTGLRAPHELAAYE
jgi:TRAP-type C4-dicarboxylate transport system permease small subunit